MEAAEFADQIVGEYDCRREVAEQIAQKAEEYHSNRTTSKTVSDWISAMLEYSRDDPVSAWNWAVSAKDATNWNIGSEESGESPYKINR